MNHARLDRSRRKLLLFAAAATCSAIALLTGAVPASAASSQGPQTKTLTVTFKIGRVSALPSSQRAQASVLCEPALDKYNRTQVCWEQVLTFTFLENGEPVGTLVADLVQSISLNAAGRSWTEHDTVAEAVPAGVTAPVEAVMGASCDSPCNAVAHFAGVIQTGLAGVVDYTDDVAKGGVNTTPTHYTLDYDAPPYIPTSVGAWDSPISYRCDDDMPGIAGPGCVFPEFTPTLILSRGEFGAAAAMIQWAQANLDGKWGLPDHELTRLAVTTKSNNNNKIICRRGWHPFGPWVAGKVSVKDSCDEFPFAATYQSGALNGVTSGKQCAQVEAVKTSDTGSVAKIWNEVRPIGKFSPDAKCVRGHIPLTLNVDLGRDGYLDFIKSERLLNEDPFLLTVTG
jgi:hypothetical protein